MERGRMDGDGWMGERVRMDGCGYGHACVLGYLFHPDRGRYAVCSMQ